MHKYQTLGQMKLHRTVTDAGSDGGTEAHNERVLREKRLLTGEK